MSCARHALLLLLRLQHGLQPLLLLVESWRAVHRRHLHLEVLLLLLFGLCLSSSSGSRSGSGGGPLLCCLQASGHALDLALLLQLQQCLTDLLGPAAKPVTDSVTKQPAGSTAAGTEASSQASGTQKSGRLKPFQVLCSKDRAHMGLPYAIHLLPVAACLQTP